MAKVECDICAGLKHCCECDGTGECAKCEGEGVIEEGDLE